MDRWLQQEMLDEPFHGVGSFGDGVVNEHIVPSEDNNNDSVVVDLISGSPEQHFYWTLAGN